MSDYEGWVKYMEWKKAAMHKEERSNNLLEDPDLLVKKMTGNG